MDKYLALKSDLKNALRGLNIKKSRHFSFLNESIETRKPFLNDRQTLYRLNNKTRLRRLIDIQVQ